MKRKNEECTFFIFFFVKHKKTKSIKLHKIGGKNEKKFNSCACRWMDGCYKFLADRSKHYTKLEKMKIKFNLCDRRWMEGCYKFLADRSKPKLLVYNVMQVCSLYSKRTHSLVREHILQ